MINKKTAQLDAHDYFSNATQAALTIIENVINQHRCASPNLNDLLYFCYVFLGIILSRLNFKKREMLVHHHLREVLQLASENGKTMCEVLMSSKIDTQGERIEAMQTLVTSIGGSGRVNSRLFLEVAKHTHSLGMVNDGLWKLNHNLQYTNALEKDIELKLIELIDEKISEATQKEIKVEGDCPELSFFITAAINTGVMIGHVSVLYHQSVDQMIDDAIKQIGGIKHDKDKQGLEEVKESSYLN